MSVEWIEEGWWRDTALASEPTNENGGMYVIQFLNFLDRFQPLGELCCWSLGLLVVRKAIDQAPEIKPQHPPLHLNEAINGMKGVCVECK